MFNPLRQKTDPSTPTIVIAAGGSGGHISPALAVAESLRYTADGARVLCVCGAKPFEAAMYRDSGWEPTVLNCRALQGKNPLKLALAGLSLIAAAFKMRRLLKREGATAALGMGGYVSLPTLFAARTLGLPIWVHEQNAIPGRTNRMLARLADVASAPYPQALDLLPAGERFTCPNPLKRRFMEEPPTLNESLVEFDLRPDRPVVLMLGGSQGAARLNEVFFDSLQLLSKKEDSVFPEVLWATGPRHFDGWEARLTELGDLAAHVRLFDFIERMPQAYVAADVVLSRSGAGTLAELAASGTPSILVPYPHAMGDHQWHNAQPFFQRGAAVLADEKELTAEALATTMADLLIDEEEREAMAHAARSLASHGAADFIADGITALAAGRELDSAPSAFAPDLDSWTHVPAKRPPALSAASSKSNSTKTAEAA